MQRASMEHPSFASTWQIALPLSGPALAFNAISTFTWNWNDFFWPFLVISNPATADGATWSGLVCGQEPNSLGPGDGWLSACHATGAVDLPDLPEIFHPWDCADWNEVKPWR